MSQQRPRGLFDPIHAMKRMRRNEDGVTAIEFAFVGPIFFVLMLAIMQYSYIFITETVMDDAVLAAVREARLGELQGRAGMPDLHAAELRRGICNRSSVLIVNCNGRSDFTVDVRTYPDFASIDLTDDLNAGGEPGAGGPSDIVAVRVIYDLPLFGFLGIGFDNLTTLRLRSLAIFRNEPFTINAPAA